MSEAGHLDLDYDAEQVALADSVRRWLARHQPETHAEGLPTTLWRDLAGLGVLGLGTPAGGGGALEIAAVMEVLGAAVAPGPLVGTFIAGRLLGEEEGEALAAGRLVVAVGRPPLLPWAAVAGAFIELGGRTEAWSARAVGPIEPVDTLAGEPWGRVTLERLAPLEGVGDALAVGDVAVAAYLVGAADQLVTTTATWLQDRVQFGRAIGEFQSLAHPLTDVAIRTRAARGLVRAAAYGVAVRAAGGAAAAATARLSATRAAVDATYRAHQSFGALGFTREGPVARIGQRIRQLSLHPPGPAAARETALAGHGL